MIATILFLTSMALFVSIRRCFILQRRIEALEYMLDLRIAIGPNNEG